MARCYNVGSLERKWWGPLSRLAAPLLVRTIGPGRRCRRVLVADDVQQLNVRAVPRVMRPDILGNQGAQCVEPEVVGWCFAGRQSCAEGMRPSVKWGGMKVHDARAAEAVQLLGAASAEVMPKERGAVLVKYLPADAAPFPGRGCGASPSGILRRGTVGGTFGSLYGSGRALVQCGVVGGAVAVSQWLPWARVCG